MGRPSTCGVGRKAFLWPLSGAPSTAASAQGSMPAPSPLCHLPPEQLPQPRPSCLSGLSRLCTPGGAHSSRSGGLADPVWAPRPVQMPPPQFGPDLGPAVRPLAGQGWAGQPRGFFLASLYTTAQHPSSLPPHSSPGLRNPRNCCGHKASPAFIFLLVETQKSPFSLTSDGGSEQDGRGAGEAGPAGNLLAAYSVAPPWPP